MKTFEPLLFEEVKAQIVQQQKDEGEGTFLFKFSSLIVLCENWFLFQPELENSELITFCLLFNFGHCILPFLLFLLELIVSIWTWYVVQYHPFVSFSSQLTVQAYLSILLCPHLRHVILSKYFYHECMGFHLQWQNGRWDWWWNAVRLMGFTFQQWPMKLMRTSRYSRMTFCYYQKKRYQINLT